MFAAAAAVGIVALQAWPALAANTPQIGPVPGWVRAAPALPPEKDDAKGLPLAMLLSDTQLSFDAEGWTEYHLVEAKVQTPEGLQALSAIPFEWSPWSDTLTFHSARIHRDGQVIDVLPKDGVFTVMRRETGLERAMLTGQLTAVLQPDGMQVGDIFELAISIRHADPLLKGRTGALFTNWDISPVGLARMEAHWPSSLPIRWRESAGLPPLRPVEAGGVTTVVLQLENVHPLVLPAHAPARFQHGRQIEFSSLPDWSALAKMMAPLYVKAEDLGPQSAVAAEAKRIAATSTDPKVRAAEALKLVQTEVRYLAHVEAAGGYTPQSADETWRLRYGDCKAKTVLLLALLRQLGVPAEPVLANPTGSDGLNARLPSALWFNHVLVRVKLGGRDYWLDGARQGDRSLDDLATPNYGWVLPLESAGGGLVHLVPEPNRDPQVRHVIVYDASGGVAAPEPTKLETTFRGDVAVLIHAQLSAVPPDRLDAALKAYWAGVHTAFTAAHVAAAWNPASGEETLTADGTSKLDWSGSGLQLEHVGLGGAPDIKRDPASIDPDAPYVVGFPSYSEVDESVVLPPGVVVPADTLKGYQVNQTIGGVAYRRTAAITGNVFRVVASQRALQPEISAAEARASVDPLTKLGDIGIYAPPPTAESWVQRAAQDGGYGSAAANADIEAASKLAPDDMRLQLWKVNAAMFRRDFAAARSLMDRLIKDHPETLGDLLIGRALIESKLGDVGQMEADFVKARALVSAAPDKENLCRNEVEAKWSPETALTDCQKALAAKPGSVGVQLNVLVLFHRLGRDQSINQPLAALEAATHDPGPLNTICYRLAVENIALDHALADCEASLKLRPDSAATLDSRGFVLMRLGRNAEALTAYDAALKANPKEANSLYGRGLVEARLGRMADSQHDQSAALALNPHVREDFAAMGLS